MALLPPSEEMNLMEKEALIIKTQFQNRICLLAMSLPVSGANGLGFQLLWPNI